MAERRAVRIGRLTTIMEVAAELGRVYRDARHKKIDAAFQSVVGHLVSDAAMPGNCRV